MYRKDAFSIFLVFVVGSLTVGSFLELLSPQPIRDTLNMLNNKFNSFIFSPLYNLNKLTIINLFKL